MSLKCSLTVPSHRSSVEVLHHPCRVASGPGVQGLLVDVVSLPVWQEAVSRGSRWVVWAPQSLLSTPLSFSAFVCEEGDWRCVWRLDVEISHSEGPNGSGKLWTPFNLQEPASVLLSWNPFIKMQPLRWLRNELYKEKAKIYWRYWSPYCQGLLAF